MARRPALWVLIIVSLSCWAGGTSQASAADRQLTAVSFTSATDGWVVRNDPSTLLRTTDGGITWRRLATDLPPIKQLAFTRDGTGWRRPRSDICSGSRTVVTAGRRHRCRGRPGACRSPTASTPGYRWAQGDHLPARWMEAGRGR
jgi:hypothetical protein